MLENAEPASMGPRERSRGNKLTSNGTISKWALQWGRAKDRAEMNPKCYAWNVLSGLQWGRAKDRAEIINA